MPEDIFDEVASGSGAAAVQEPDIFDQVASEGSISQWNPSTYQRLEMALPNVFQREGTQADPEHPAGGIPNLLKASAESPLDNVLKPMPVTREDGIMSAAGKEAWNIAIGLPKFATSLQGAVAGLAGTAGPAAGRVVAGLFSADMFKSFGESVHSLYKDWDTMTPGQRTAAIEDAVSSGLLGGILAKHAITKPKVETKAAAAPAAPLSENESQKPATASESTPEQIVKTGPPEQGLPLYTVESDDGYGHWVVDPEGKGVGIIHKTKEDADFAAQSLNEAAAQNKVDLNAGLSDEAKTLLEQHKDAAGGLDIITDEDIKNEEGKRDLTTADDPSNPFSMGRYYKQIGDFLRKAQPVATVDQHGKRIVINRSGFNKWLESIQPEKRGQAVRSVLSEERIHLHVEDADALSFWNNLSKVEKWATRRKYKNDEDMSDTLWGHEAIRYRIQQLSRMTPTEIAQEYGGKGALRERMTIKAIDALEAIVRKIRSATSSTATSEMNDILDRVDSNLKAGRIAAASKGMVKVSPHEDALLREADELEEAAKGFSGPEAEEMRQMAQWSRDKAFPSARGRKQQDDPKQATFEPLLSRAKFEEIHRTIGDTTGRMQRKVDDEMFRRAQAESGQGPHGAPESELTPKQRAESRRNNSRENAGWGDLARPPMARGRGRPAKERIDPWAKGLMFEPEAFAAGGAPEKSERTLAPEQAPHLPTATDINTAAYQWISKPGNVPDFKSFSDYMKRNFKTQPGQVKDMFQKLLVSHLSKASGDFLHNTIEKVFGKEHPYAKMRIPDEMETGKHLESKIAVVEGGLGLDVPENQMPREVKIVREPGESQQKFEARRLAARPLTGLANPIAAILESAKGPAESKGVSDEELRQRMRTKAVSMIVKRLIEPLMENDAETLSRSKVTPSELSPVGAAEGIASGHQELSAQDEHDPNLPNVLVDRSRRSAKDRASITRRLTVIQNRKTGEVHMVSTWRNPTSGRVFFANPHLKAGEGLRLDEALKNYRMLRSLLLDEPVERFSQSYDSIKDYNKQFGDEARENYENTTSYDPDTVPIHEFMEGTEPEATEGVEHGEGGSMIGPGKALVEAATGGGRSSIEESRRSRITTAEGNAVSEAFAEAKTPEQIEGVIKTLHESQFSKLREAFQKATVKLERANTALKRALSARQDPGKTTPEEHAERVAKAQEAVIRLQGEAADASRSFRQNALLRSGVAKMAMAIDRGNRRALKPVEDLMSQLVMRIHSIGERTETHQDFINLLREGLSAPAERKAASGEWTPRPPSGKMSLYEQVKRGLDLPSSRLVLKDKPGAPRVVTTEAELAPSAIEPVQMLSPADVEHIVKVSQDPSLHSDPEQAKMRQRLIDTGRASTRLGEVSERPLTEENKITPLHFTPEETAEINRYMAEEKTRREREAFMDMLQNRFGGAKQVEASQKVAHEANIEAAKRGEIRNIHAKDIPSETLALSGEKARGPVGTADAETLARFDKIRQEQRQKATQRNFPLAPGRRRSSGMGEALSDAASKYASIGSAWMKRGNAQAVIAAGCDAYQTVSRNFGRVIGNEIRTLSKSNGKEQKGVLGGAIAMQAAKPFDKAYKYSPEAVAEYDKLASENPFMQLGHKMLDVSDPHQLKMFIMDAKDKPEFKGMEGLLHKVIGEINMGNTVPSKNFEGRAVKRIALRDEKGHTIGWKDAPHAIPDSVRRMGLEMIKETERKIENTLVGQGLLNHEGVTYKFNPLAKSKLDEFALAVNNGIRKATAMLEGGKWSERRKARAWLKDLNLHKADLEFARAHWDDKQLQEVTEKAQSELDLQFDRERQAGTTISYNDAYMPGRYDGQFHNNDSIMFGPKILGRQFGAGKAFNNYYEAAGADPYIAATHDISNIVEHRVRQGMTKIGLRGWEAELLTMTDEATGRPAFVASKKVGDTWIPDLPSGVSGSDYTAVSTSTTRAPVYALTGDYARWLKQLTSPSAIEEFAPTRAALQAGQYLKHVALVGDIFHLARVTYYGASIIGKKALNAYSAHTPGWAALDFREEGLDKALEHGVLSESTVKWLKEPLPVTINGVKGTMSRIQLSKEFQKTGFNVGQISDAIYKDLVAKLPIIGRYNKFLFDRYQRGLMMRSALDEFERRHKLDPSRDSRILMRDIGHDLNSYFGSIGRQGWIKSATFQDLARVMFLSPQWVEGIVKKDISVPYKMVSSLKDGWKGAARLAKGDDTSARGITRGLISMLVLTQVINLINRRQPTWMNEEGHKMEADLGDNTWLNPLTVFNETLNEFIRYNETRPNAWSAIQQIGENKLGFVGRASLIAVTHKTALGRNITSSTGIAKEMAKSLIPVPITLNAPMQWAENKASGGTMAEPVSAQMARRSAMGVIGLKVETGRRAEVEMEDVARRFVKDNKLKNDAVSTMLNDEPAYSDVRRQLQLGNPAGAKKALDALRAKGVKESAVISAMKRWEHQPFTGSRRNELIWLHSLNEGQLAKYREAIESKRALYHQWLDFYINEKD